MDEISGKFLDKNSSLLKVEKKISQKNDKEKGMLFASKPHILKTWYFIQPLLTLVDQLPKGPPLDLHRNFLCSNKVGHFI